MKIIATVVTSILLAGCAATNDHQPPEANLSYSLIRTVPFSKNTINTDIPVSLYKNNPRTVSVDSPFTIRRCESPDLCSQGVVTIVSQLTLIEKSDDHATVSLSSNVTVGRQGTFKSGSSKETRTINEEVPLITEQAFSVNRTLVLSRGHAQTVRLLPEAELVVDLK
ncbi:hypothetical protein [Paludibacterium denitrificans]|uniref:Lipoprotein n=1 Tax=Paludibacterium denitrificans TaxID=2675226 RepID=A0A844G7S8_9NEIS|nr:hypothetical protein [Paludibacterium denitrificans]MTD32396.1 hypothetical protein [Paludibacterium denitrificans]